MKSFLLFFICFGLGLTSFAALAAKPKSDEELSKQLSKMFKSSRIPPENVAVYITKADGKVLYEQNAKHLMVPASITKVITAGAVLKNFPMDVKFKTQLLSSAKMAEGELQGDLCFKGGGDPGFVSENMWFLVNEFRRTEISKIKGNLILDSSLFDEELYDSGRDSVRVDRAYDAPIDALSFNWNSVNVFVRPGSKVGESLHVFVDPVNEYVKLVNKGKTVSGSKKDLSVSREKDGDKEVIIVKGSLGIDAPEAVYYKSITRPALWTGYNLLDFFKQRNIHLDGKLIKGNCAKDAVILASNDSKPLSHCLADMLKFSSNYVAEMLVKNLAALKGATPAKMEDGVEMGRKFLEEIGIPRKEFELENMSGLTRKNKISPKQFWTVLQYLQKNFQLFPEFLTGLPIGGVDGTLKNRMKGTGAEKWVRAKTGFLTGVVSLAGYVGRDDEGPVNFVMIYNGPASLDMHVKDFYDEVVGQLIED